MKTLATLLLMIVTLTMVSCSPPPSVAEVITQAIKARRTVLLYYDQGDDAGPQVVEPHLLGRTESDNQVLRAWFLHTIPKSTKGPGWRLYMVSRIRSIKLADPFEWPRPDHDPTGGKAFKTVEAAL